MFPHQIDRYRIIAKLLWMEKETYDDRKYHQVGIGQKVLAEKADVSQATVSNIQNLDKSIGSPKRRVSRRQMLQVLTWGLGLPQQKVDAVLWLFDETTLTEDEIRRYLRGYLPKAAPENYRYEELRGVILDRLEETFTYSTGIIDQGAQRAKLVKSIATGDITANLAAVNELSEMENEPGQRMLVMRYPSFLALPPQSYPSGELIEDIVSEFRALNEKRMQNLTDFGERSIHHKGSIENYIERGPNDLSEEMRNAQIRSWIVLLESSRHPQYKIRLSETPLAMEQSIKTVAPAMVGAMVNEEPPWISTGWKLRWIKLFDDTAVLGLYLGFERQWDNIPNEYRANSQVVEFLKYLVDNAG